MNLKSPHCWIVGLVTSAAFALGSSCLATPPSNDHCANATVLQGAEYEMYGLDISQATTDACEATAGSCDAGSIRSVWYKFTAPADGEVSISAIASDDRPVLSVFSGCAIPIFGGCAQPDVLACAADDGLYDPASIYNLGVGSGQTILIRLAAINSGDGILYVFGFSFHTSVPNESCATATVIPPAGIDQTFDTYLADDDGCEDYFELSCADQFWGTRGSVWYRYDAVADGTLNIHTDGSDYGTVVGVYNGCMFNSPQLGCVSPPELLCAAGLPPAGVMIALPVLAGQLYVIRVADDADEDGSMLHFACKFTPANDHCGQATTINTNMYNPPAFSVEYTDVSAQEPQESCHSAIFGVNESVFYKFTPAANGTANINTIGSNYDTVLSVHDGCGTLVLPSGWLQPVLLACNNDIGGFFGAASQVSGVPMQAGHEYLIKVAANGLGGTDDLLDFNFQFTPTPACVADIAPVGGDGSVNTSDLLAVINGWGQCGNPLVCPADIAPVTPDGVVNVADLLAVINTWGPCP